MRKLKVIPSMHCDDGCGDCCVPAPATETEFGAVARYVREHGIKPIDQGVTCPLYQNGRCTVYAVRPLACRLFGHVNGMTCTRGYDVAIPEREIARMVRANGSATRCLHELLPNFAVRLAEHRRDHP